MPTPLKSRADYKTYPITPQSKTPIDPLNYPNNYSQEPPKLDRIEHY